MMIRDTDACINTNWSIDLVSFYCTFLKNDNIIRSKPVYYLIDLYIHRFYFKIHISLKNLSIEQMWVIYIV